MARLYPPNIQGVIPAFYGTTLVVPFSMNKAVGEREISGFEVKIKTISGMVKGSASAYKEETKEENSGYIDFSTNQVIFELSDIGFQVGQFYKIQLAYISKVDSIVGYYSTVGVAKYTTEPRVFIEGLEEDASNTHIYNYVGVYSQESLVSGSKKDATEKMYSSRFRVWDENGDLYKDTGDVVHNTTTDINSYESSEQFSLLEDLEQEKIFTIQFSVKTVNYLEMSSPKYRIKQRKSIDAEQRVFIYAENDFVNGGIDLKLEGDNQDTLSGSFIISRANSKTKFLDWEKVFDFTLEQAIDPKKWSAKDFTCEQGVTYKYSIQQYNENGVYSEKTYSDYVFSDFEDSFLYDGKKLLNIRFNPKVSSFKINLAENKQDTIGSQFPYFFRNGRVRYKEFPISGLISYLSDVDNLFNDIQSLYTTDLISENISTERDFKLDVLNWLTNGQPKLFKSPGEGNYIVRLMNTSLSPQDPLNRMLHSFSCTAYELMECNGENLFGNGLVGNLNIPNPIRATKTVNLVDSENKIVFDPNKKEGKGYFYDLVTTGAKTISFIGLMPGTIVKIDNNEFCIGSTGSLYYDAGEDSVIKKVSIWLDENTQLDGSFTYTYGKITDGVFEIVSSIKSQEVPIIQFFGNYYNQEKLINQTTGEEMTSNNIYDFLQDARTTITKMYMIRLLRRDSEEIFIKPEDLMGRAAAPFQENGTVDIESFCFYRDKECSESKRIGDIKYFTANKYYPIRLGYTESDKLKEDFAFEGYYLDRLDGKQVCPYLDWAIDGLSLSYFELNDSCYDSYVDGSKINMAERDTYELPNPEVYSSLEIGKAVTAELSFVKMISSYTIEDSIPILTRLRNEYLNLLENSLQLDSDYKYYFSKDESKIEIDPVSQKQIVTYYLEYMNNTGNNGGRIESSAALRAAYYKYLSELSKDLEEYKQRMAIL